MVTGWLQEPLKCICTFDFYLEVQLLSNTAKRAVNTFISTDVGPFLSNYYDNNVPKQSTCLLDFISKRLFKEAIN